MINWIENAKNRNRSFINLGFTNGWNKDTYDKFNELLKYKISDEKINKYRVETQYQFDIDYNGDKFTVYYSTDSGD